MRVVHLTRTGDRPHAEPLCGDWGSMDADWTDIAGGATCPACRAMLREAQSYVASVPVRRTIGDRRRVDGW
jgi:hypothetical protein